MGIALEICKDDIAIQPAHLQIRMEMKPLNQHLRVPILNLLSFFTWVISTTTMSNNCSFQLTLYLITQSHEVVFARCHCTDKERSRREEVPSRLFLVVFKLMFGKSLQLYLVETPDLKTERDLEMLEHLLRMQLLTLTYSTAQFSYTEHCKRNCRHQKICFSAAAHQQK